MILYRLGLTALVALFTSLLGIAAPPTITRWTLDNGIRVVVLHFQGSEHCAIFSLLPLGLGADGADCTQWSHLVEHLTLRTTGPITDYLERNAETMPSGMHLDWMGAAAKWKEGLDLQTKWLSGLPFEEQISREEIPKALSEVDSTVPRGFTHKWAFAAWNQVVRQQREHVEVRGALARAPLAEITRYRDEHLVIPGRTLICVAGGIPAETVRAAITEQIGKVQSKAKALPAATAAPRKSPADLRAKWDLPARHLMVTWPIPSPDASDYPALHLAAQTLAMALATDSELQGRKAPIFASAEAVTQEASFFVISGPVSDANDAERVRRRIAHHIGMLRDRAVPTVPMMAQGLSTQMSPEALDPAAIRAQGVPAQVTDAMLEANIALQRALLEWQHKDVASFAKEMKALTAEIVANAVRRHLSDDRCTTLLLEPKGE